MKLSAIIIIEHQPQPHIENRVKTNIFWKVLNALIIPQWFKFYETKEAKRKQETFIKQIPNRIENRVY